MKSFFSSSSENLDNLSDIVKKWQTSGREIEFVFVCVNLIQCTYMAGIVSELVSWDYFSLFYTRKYLESIVCMGEIVASVLM